MPKSERKESCCSSSSNVIDVSPNGRFVKYDEILGKNPFKVVYRGFDKIDGIEVAWYQISINDDHKTSELDKTLKISQSLNHNNVIKCYSYWIDSGSMNVNMITELFSSGTLRTYRNKHKSVVEMRAIKNWCKQILMGLKYLHSREPPVIHKDLRCDNIFINGNNLGEVKIGNLGMVTLTMDYGTARNFVGRPEFMAPELYDDDGYNELADVYSFGMCMLELITCESPYAECKSLAHIFKKVSTGVKPLALKKVQDQQIKEFIEKCLVPASKRLSSTELLRDPLFSFVNSEEDVSESLLLPASTDVPNTVLQDFVCVDSIYDMFSRQTSFSSNNGKTSDSTTLESWQYSEQIQLRLRGKMIYEKAISFNLLIQTDSGANNFEFVFDLEADDAAKIAQELVQVESLTEENVPLVIELIDSMILDLEPGWKSCCGYFSERTNVSSEFGYVKISDRTSVEGDTSTSLDHSADNIKKTCPAPESINMDSLDYLDHNFERIKKKNSPDLNLAFEGIKKRDSPDLNSRFGSIKRSSSL